MKHDERTLCEGLSRRRFLVTGAGAIVAAGSVSALGSHRGPFELVAARTGSIGGYVCPPCGQECDKLTFEKPGKCPQCGMALITSDPSEGPDPTVAILLFNSAEIIDFAGPWEVFGGAGYRVFTVSERPEPITAVYGQKVTADYTFENCPKAYVLLVPGGGVRNAVNNLRLIAWLQGYAGRSNHVMSVCTGAFILAKAGLLDGLSATTVRGGIDNLASAGKNITVIHDKRYVDNGKIITTAGLSSGIDGALYLVSKMLGKATAQQVALGMEYNWDPDAKYVRAAFADRYLPNFSGLDGKLVSVDGDTDRWEIRSLVSSPASVSGIIDLTQKQIVSNTPYRSSPVQVTREASKASDRTAFEWKFKDEVGRRWTGTCAVAESVVEKGKFDLTVRLAKN